MASLRLELRERNRMEIYFGEISKSCFESVGTMGLGECIKRREIFRGRVGGVVILKFSLLGGVSSYDGERRFVREVGE